LFEKLQSLVVSNSEFDPYRKVPKRCCYEVMVQFSICQPLKKRGLITYECMHETVISFVSLQQLPTDCSIFKLLCLGISATARLTWYVKQSIALLEEMYTRICEENGPADPVLQGVVATGVFASRLWWGS
jgi:hypothetical protein